jgi:DNA-directed RNA polymerase specialized sigma subunit
MEELEKLVIGLYYNQNKTFREVQKIVRKSPGDIRLILDKANPHSKSNNPKHKQTQSSQAFQMFEEGSTPIQVANTLGLREKEISELYRAVESQWYV